MSTEAVGTIRLYHGSPERDFTPTFGLGRDQHDYGRGFYLTAFPDLAREWAVAASPGADGWLHAYDLRLDGLRILDFTVLGSLPWLAELMKHRNADESRYYRENAGKFIAKYGVDLGDDYVVRGWSANASFFYIAKSFVRNNIGVDFLSKLLTLGNLGIQYFVKSERAFDRLEEVVEAREPVRAAEYHGKYDTRDADARALMYDLIENSPENDLSRTFKDIV